MFVDDDLHTVHQFDTVEKGTIGFYAHFVQYFFCFSDDDVDVSIFAFLVFVGDMSFMDVVLNGFDDFFQVF